MGKLNGWPVIKSEVCVGRERGRCVVAEGKRQRDRVDCEFERRTLVTNDPPGSDKRR